MKQEAEWHNHPEPGEPNHVGKVARVYGRLLEPGDTLQEGDLYSSSNGYFERCTCPGLTLQSGLQKGKTSILWVRPS